MNQSDLDSILPPPEPKSIYPIAIAGAALCVVACGIGFATDSGPGFVSTLRLLMVAAGCLAAGSAISMRPSLPLTWFIAAIAFGVSYYGLPAHWDSARIVAFVGMCVCLGGAILSAIPFTFRCSVLSAMAMWHFGGIFCATTWPDPAPWTTQQVGTRMYLPYLMFMYLRNAYHFYSPEPGPASHIFALVKYDTKDANGKQEANWITLPNRSEHMKDPLGLAYYRRLSITEQAAQTMPPMGYTFETPEVVKRRMEAAGLAGGIPGYPRIPMAPDEIEPQSMQYRTPRPDISRYLLPSYANHILLTQSTPQRKATSVKIYRLEHRVLPAQAFALGGNPHHPTTYRPYYLGEFERNPATGKVELIDSQDPLLYWLVPILPRHKSPNSPRDFEDYMSEHARYTYDWEKRQP